MSSTVTLPTAAPVLLMTAEEFVRRYLRANFELVKGVLKELPVPFLKHGRICFLIARFIEEAAERQTLGRVMTNDSFVKTRSNPDSVRGADVCYFSYDRLPRGQVPDGLLSVVPDLVVEVRSPSDTWTEIFAKVSEYLAAGVRAVVVLDAVSTSASVYRAEELQQIFHNGDELTVPEVLPGFAVAVRRLFE